MSIRYPQQSWSGKGCVAMKKNKIKNPLTKRIPRELTGDWKKYLVVALFLILTIGFVSGMYVANESMMTAADEGVTKYKLEDGHFELKKKADDALLKAIASGNKADVKQYYYDKAKDELDKKFASEFEEKFTEEFKTEFEKKFNEEFDSSFAKEFDEKYEEAFREQFDKAFEDEFAEQFEQKISEQLAAQGLDEESEKKMLDAAVEAAKKDGTYQKAYDEAYSSAYKEAYDKARSKNYDESYEAAYKEAYKPAYDKAYDEAYKESHDKAYEEAYNKAWDEVSEEIDKKYADASEKYELDDEDFEPVSANVYENFYRNEEEDYNGDGTVDGTIRVYEKKDDINLACLMEGSLPQTSDEIALDRMHADNVGIKVGDVISVSGEEYHVTGLIAYVNYSTLHEKSTDLMFDALKFNVAMVTAEGFERLSKSVHYCYAWTYEEKPKSTAEEKSKSDDFMKALVTQTVTADNELTDYTPTYANPAVQFATEDMGSDEAMGGVLLDVLIVIIAFIFAITISNTITKESATIGTLRAMGYKRAELVCHYLSMPVIVTLVAACIGNVLGYTLFKKVVVGMYYNSYSLPTYETRWNADAFLKTTIIPVVLMLVVNLVVIVKMMHHTPLQFLRHDLKKTKRKKAMRLPRWSFLNRFRIRIILQNVVNYAVLFAGIFFIAVLLAMAVGMPSTLEYYKSNTENMMFANHQYVLTSYEDEDGNTVTTENESAEPFCMTSLVRKSDALDEEVSIYGISDDSSYVKIADLADLSGNEVYVSETFADKYGLSAGDTIKLDEKYESKQYEFTVKGTYSRSQSISVFMPIEEYREIFGQEEGEFSGYLSDTEITDIDEDLIATVITERDITKMCDQLDHSMGSYMEYFQILCILLSAVLIYLLTKIIIEKNENAISMTKILGYENREIAGLYLLSTTIVVLISDAICVFLGAVVMKLVWRAVFLTYSGWYTFYMYPMDYVKMYVFIIVGYLIVMVIDFNRIKKIPMDEALKNVE